MGEAKRSKYPVWRGTAFLSIGVCVSILLSGCFAAGVGTVAIMDAPRIAALPKEEARHFVLNVDIQVDGKASRVEYAWHCEHELSFPAGTMEWQRIWRTRVRTIVRQLHDNLAVIFDPPSNLCDPNTVERTYLPTVFVARELKEPSQLEGYMRAPIVWLREPLVVSSGVVRSHSPGPDTMYSKEEEGLYLHLKERGKGYVSFSATFVPEEVWNTSPALVQTFKDAKQILSASDFADPFRRRGSANFPRGSFDPALLQKLTTRPMSKIGNNWVLSPGGGLRFLFDPKRASDPYPDLKREVDMVKYKEATFSVEGSLEIFDPEERAIVQFRRHKFPYVW